MKKLLDIQKANLFKEAFALAIKEQQNLIVKKENAIKYNFHLITGGGFAKMEIKKLREGINDNRQYIEFYTEMYLNAEELRITITDKRYEQFSAKYQKASKPKNEVKYD